MKKNYKMTKCIENSEMKQPRESGWAGLTILK